MRLIETWIERHPVLSKIGRAVIIMSVLYGGMWAFATWTVKQAKPDTPSAHIFCGVLSTNPDGSFDAATGGKEFELSKDLAYQQGGAEGVAKAKAEGQAIMAEYLEHMKKGDLDDLRRHYQDKCLGY